MSEQVFARLPDEPRKAHRLFCIYRDMGESRTLKSCARRCNLSFSYLSSLSTRYDWVKRAEAWDSHLDLQKRLAKTKEVVEMNSRHALIATLFQQKVIDKLASMNDADVEALTPEQTIAWFTQSARVELRARGEPDQITHSKANIRQQVSQTNTVEIIETVVRTPDDVRAAKANPKGELVTE